MFTTIPDGQMLPQTKEFLQDETEIVAHVTRIAVTCDNW